MEQYIDIKELQPNGWTYKNPPQTEIPTTKKPLTKHQVEALFKHQQKRVNELTSLLLERGITPNTSDTALPVQLLSANGDMNYGNKSDLLKYLYKEYSTSFITETELYKETSKHSNVSCLISDGMFKFRDCSLKHKASLKDICKSKALQVVKSNFSKYANGEKVFTIVTVFDRRADRTKELTESQRGESPPTAVNYNAKMEINYDEMMVNYASQWRDREFGRRKIITAYSGFFKDKTNVESLNFPPGSHYIVVGGEGKLCSATEIDRSSRCVILDEKPYNSLHPEADTGVFILSRLFLINILRQKAVMS